MAKIAIYDKFYESAAYPDADIAGRALADSEHQIVGAATDIRQAARQILDFAGGGITERPDIIIMGGRLEGEYEYRKNPLTITEPCTVRQRTWLGGVKEGVGRRITFLLPQFEQDGMTYSFPSIVSVGHVPDNPPEALVEQWKFGLTGIAACVLSRIVETYLPETAKLGVSSDLMLDAVLSMQEIDRSSTDAVHQMQRYIQALTDGT